jgi:hypothetical protein
MAKCIAESLIAHEKFDALDISKRWGVSYFVPFFAYKSNKSEYGVVVMWNWQHNAEDMSYDS